MGKNLSLGFESTIQARDLHIDASPMVCKDAYSQAIPVGEFQASCVSNSTSQQLISNTWEPVQDILKRL
jgi:hypothetical protein